MFINADTAIGQAIKYYDYLGLERYGKIVGVEPYLDDIAYIYIEDEEVEYNIHNHVINGNPIHYAEIRTSDNVYMDRD